MKIEFNNILERDIDLLLMRQFACNSEFIYNVFLNKINPEYVKSKMAVLSLKHSVATNDGESDIEVVLQIGKKRVALLIEDKIDAVAQPEQANRYKIRGEKAVRQGCYDEFYIFIIAPSKYLENNKEAIKYPYSVSYEELKPVLFNDFDLAVLEKALDESKKGYIPIEDKQVTEFWNKLYDYIEKNYPNEFAVYGKKGESRGARATWITFNCVKGLQIQVKSDRGYVDLEIANYADKFRTFSKANQDILDQEKLYLRVASNSLAIRKYIEIIDFRRPFETQEMLVKDALNNVLELQKLVKRLKF